MPYGVLYIFTKVNFSCSCQLCLQVLFLRLLALHPVSHYYSCISCQLKTAAQAFLEGEDVLVDIEKGTVALSKIFQWYKEDFGGTDSSVCYSQISNY